MPRELITIQVGQCGNQIGCRFWDLALREHASNNKLGVFDDSMSSFFRNVDSKSPDASEIPVGDGKNKIKHLKSRAVLIDMEEGVLNEILRDKNQSDLFDTKQFISDTSGSGNNWFASFEPNDLFFRAQGYNEYGPKYHEQFEELIRRPTEFCDSLQSFLILHSLGGGTGSGVGSYILGLLEDDFPEVYRFSAPIFPSEDDDVITSPYNSVLALSKLTEHADCVLPIDNQSLIDISDRISGNTTRKSSVSNKNEENVVVGVKEKRSKPFDKMNDIAAHLLLNLTCSMRFGGTLNVDLNEITMNLVPYPRMHYLISSLTPLYSLGNPNIQPRTLDQMFTDAFSKDFQLIRADPKRNLYLACALMVRGEGVEMSDIRRNIDRMKPSLDFIHWNQEGWKVGHCLAPPVGQKHALLCLSNNCSIKDVFQDLQSRFTKLYSRKAHMHHYTKFMEKQVLDDSLQSLRDLISEYSAFQNSNVPQSNSRLVPVT